MRFIVFVILVLLSGVVPAHADWWHKDTWSWCDTATKKLTVLFCEGHQPRKCGGWYTKDLNRISVPTGACVSYDAYDNDSRTFVLCCTASELIKINPAEDSNNSGYTWTDGKTPLVDNGGAWRLKYENTVVQLTGGTCKYTKYTTVTGTEVSTPCTIPDGCNNGYMLRNGKCVIPCSGDNGYASVTDNTCVPCKQTMYKGIQTQTYASKEFKPVPETKEEKVTDATGAEITRDTLDTRYRLCKECNSSTEFFYNGACVTKDYFDKVEKQYLETCGLCDTFDTMKKCAKDAKAGTISADQKKACLIN